MANVCNLLGPRYRCEYYNKLEDVIGASANRGNPQYECQEPSVAQGLFECIPIDTCAPQSEPKCRYYLTEHVGPMTCLIEMLRWQ